MPWRASSGFVAGGLREGRSWQGGQQQQQKKQQGRRAACGVGGGASGARESASSERRGKDWDWAGRDQRESEAVVSQSQPGQA